MDKEQTNHSFSALMRGVTGEALANNNGALPMAKRSYMKPISNCISVETSQLLVDSHKPSNGTVGGFEDGGLLDGDYRSAYQ